MTDSELTARLLINRPPATNTAVVLQNAGGQLLLMQVVDKSLNRTNGSIEVMFVRKTGSYEKDRELVTRTMTVGDKADEFGIHAALTNIEMPGAEFPQAVFRLSVDPAPGV